MPHAFKTPALLAACLVTIAACSSSPAVQEGPVASATTVSQSTPALRASPINLATLAALAASDDDRTIMPAKTITRDSTPLIDGDVDETFSNETLPVVPHDSPLLKGTTYFGTSFSAAQKPRMVPGVFRTIETK